MLLHERAVFIGSVYRLPQSIAYFQNTEINELIGYENLMQTLNFMNRFAWIFIKGAVNEQN